MGNLTIPRIDGIESAIKALAQGLPGLTDSQLEQIQDSLSIISEKFKFNKELMFDSEKFAEELKKKSAEKLAEKEDDKLTKRHKHMLEVMEKGNSYSREQISDLIGLKGSRTRQLLNELVELGYVECIRTTKSRRYVKIR